MSEPIIELNHVVKRFTGVTAVNDVSLSVNAGEVFALLGENGAGKSTLASIIFGLYSPDSGEIILRGQPVVIDSPAKAVSLDIGMVHQHFMLVSDYTVTENIIMGSEPVRRLAGLVPLIDSVGAEQRIQNLIDRYEFGLKATDVVENLNVSSQQRVEILKMLYRDAEILIFDEPTAMLTPQEIERLLEIIRRLRDDGKTIILITHKLDEIKQVADRCAIMNRGSLVGIYDVATTSTQLMANRMVGRELSMHIEKDPPTFGPAVLQVDNVSVVDADKVTRLRDVSLTVHAGEVFALAGVAGNGQNQLADALAGLIAHSGHILINGKDISPLSVRQRIESGLAYIPDDRQGVGLQLDMNIAENLIAKSYYRAPCVSRSFASFIDYGYAVEQAKDTIERYDVRTAEGALTPVRNLSGGNQQKLLIAREIDADADLVVFVQPTRGLDIGAIISIRQRIIEQRDRGKAVLLISLDLEEVMEVADTIAVIYNGQIVHTAPAAEYSLSDLGEYMMGVRQ